MIPGSTEPVPFDRFYKVPLILHRTSYVKHLTATEKVVLDALLSWRRPGERSVRISIRALAVIANLHPATVRKALCGLQQVGIISVLPEFGNASLYEFLPHGADMPPNGPQTISQRRA